MDQEVNNIFRDELKWLGQVIESRLNQYLQKKKPYREVDSITPPTVGEQSHYTRFVRDHKLTFNERLVLFLALVPHISPQFLDEAITGSLDQQGEFPQLGGVRGKTFRGFLPTVETALFLIAGDDLQKRFQAKDMFSADHLFSTRQVIHLSTSEDHEPVTSSRLILDPDYVELFTSGKVIRPRMSTTFPAQWITTEMDWDDLVLVPSTLKQIREIETWIRYNDVLLYDWGMKKKIKPGYRCLFHGPSGTGKTLTATLLGKYTGKDVFRIDLSTVISKYIGETEKNLSNLFDKAASKDWILFFDEADALFGKRTNIRDAHDKYANQEVSYLLQRIENHPGLIILASNFKSNIDDSFIRRFHSVIYFPFPGAEERLLLWRKSFPEQLKLANGVQLGQIAVRYELSGANIINIVQYISLKALNDERTAIEMEDIIEGIRKEYDKEGKIF